MNIQEKIEGFTKDLETVQNQLKELQKSEQRLIGAILALQDLNNSNTKNSELEVIDKSDVSNNGTSAGPNRAARRKRTSSKK